MENNITIHLVIILLVSMAVGMIIGLIVRPNDKIHGPNAKKQCRKLYYSNKMKKCVKFNIKPIICPKSKTKFHKIMEKFMCEPKN